MSACTLTAAHAMADHDMLQAQELQRQDTCTQPWVEMSFDGSQNDFSQPIAEPIAVLRSLAAGLVVSHVEIMAEMRQVTIGRLKDDVLAFEPSHLRVTVDDKRVSAEHCRIWRVDEASKEAGSTPSFMVQDNSSNGTFLNGKQLTKGKQYPLQSGDELSLVVNSYKRKRLGTRSCLCCAFVMRVLGVERSSVLKDAGNMVEEKYDLLSKVLGSGAFSQVLLCKSRRSGASMALKVVDKSKFFQFRKSRQTELTINSEREVMERIEHPNVVKLVETFDTKSSFYLVMEFLAGGDLLQRILDHGIYSTGATTRLFCDVLNGIKCLHDLGIAHRDIKPENILLTSTDELGTAKIADMGLAKYFGDSANAQTQRATVCGTPVYFAPEMVMAAEGGPSSYGKAVDMWAAGVVLYIMLCGFPPFDDENLYDQIASGNYDFEGEQWQSVSPLARDLVKNLMRVNADERLTISAALSDPWLVGDGSVKRRKTDIGSVKGASGVDSTLGLSPARKVATPIVCID